MVLTGKLGQPFLKYIFYTLKTQMLCLKYVLEIPTVFQMDSWKKGLYWSLDSEPREVNSKCFSEYGDAASSGL